MPYGTLMYSYYTNSFKIIILIIVIKNNISNCFKQYIYTYTYILYRYRYTYLWSFNFHYLPMRSEVSLPSVYKWGNWGTEWLSNLLKITQQVSHRVLLGCFIVSSCLTQKQQFLTIKGTQWTKVMPTITEALVLTLGCHQYHHQPPLL